ncbi:hypothetical protein Tco_1274717 [Tanacetum coccineum]
MRTRSQARKRRQQQVQQTSVEPPNLEKPNNNPPIVTMADNRTMAQLLEAPTEGYEDAIVIPEITANNFEIKHGLLNLGFRQKKSHRLCFHYHCGFWIHEVETKSNNDFEPQQHSHSNLAQLLFQLQLLKWPTIVYFCLPGDNFDKKFDQPPIVDFPVKIGTTHSHYQRMLPNQGVIP